MSENKKKYSKRPVIIRSVANLFLPLACVFGCYIIFHGAMSPGGGFQGGVLVSSAILLIYLAYGHRGLKNGVKYHFLHSSETVAEIIYVLIALLGVFTAGAFCLNYILPGNVIETTMLMNDAVGYHVMAGISCLLVMMLGTLHADEAEEEEDEE